MTIINWGCMKFPCNRKDIDRFKEDNQGLIYINVYKALNKHTITDRMTKVQNAEHEIHLLMIEQENNHHYVLIKDLSELVGCQYNKNTKEANMPALLKRASINRRIKKHIEHGCLAIEGQRIEMPTKGDTIHFKNKSR